ncbi:MAG: hypothetical protein JXR95_15730 [Deltaproteobacteria bacterium]|nr:hypothetical protein [Deltaproteobacteria bacterium]
MFLIIFLRIISAVFPEAVIEQKKPPSGKYLCVLALREQPKDYTLIVKWISEYFESGKIPVKAIWIKSEKANTPEKTAEIFFKNNKGVCNPGIFISTTPKAVLHLYASTPKKNRYLKREIQGSTPDEYLEISVVIVEQILKVLNSGKTELLEKFTGMKSVKMNFNFEKTSESDRDTGVFSGLKVFSYNSQNYFVPALSIGFYSRFLKNSGLLFSYDFTGTIFDEGNLLKISVKRHPFTFRWFYRFVTGIFSLLPYAGITLDFMTTNITPLSPWIESLSPKGQLGITGVLGIRLQYELNSRIRLFLQSGSEFLIMRKYYTAAGLDSSGTYREEEYGRSFSYGVDFSAGISVKFF